MNGQLRPFSVNKGQLLAEIKWKMLRPAVCSSDAVFLAKFRNDGRGVCLFCFVYASSKQHVPRVVYFAFKL